MYPPNDLSHKTDERETKSTISLEKLVKIATSRILFCLLDIFFFFFYHDICIFRDWFTPVPLRFIHSAYRLTNCFPFSERQFVIRTRGRNETAHDAFIEWRPFDSQCLLSLGRRFGRYDYNLHRSTLFFRIFNFLLSIFRFNSCDFFVNSICTYDYRYKIMVDHKSRVASNQWHLTIITK